MKGDARNHKHIRGPSFVSYVFSYQILSSGTHAQELSLFHLLCRHNNKFWRSALKVCVSEGICSRNHLRPNYKDNSLGTLVLSYIVVCSVHALVSIPFHTRLLTMSCARWKMRTSSNSFESSPNRYLANDGETLGESILRDILQKWQGHEK